MALNNDTILTTATVLSADRQTGLPTLIRLCTDLNEHLRRSAALTLVVCALDGLPAEDTSIPGPSIMVEIARIATDSARAVANARLYRTAYDSLALILPMTSRSVGVQIASNIRSGVEHIGNGITATLAVASAPHDAGEAGALLAVCEVQLLSGANKRNAVYTAAPVESLPPVAARLANLLIARVIALAELGEQLRVTEQQALHDPVTGLPNARALEQRLPRYIEHAVQTALPLALLLIDGDNLKEYNSRYGYNAGNEWIRSIAHVVSSTLRPGDFAARWMMGDEFVVLLPDTPQDKAREIAELLRQKVEQSGQTSQYPGTISIGVVNVDGNASPDRILERAREALIAAKDSGRNQISLLSL